MSQSSDARLTLYGRPATKDDIAREVARLYLGNPSKHQEAQTPSKIAKTLGYKQPKSVYNYMDLAVELGLLKKTTLTDEATGQQKSRYEKPEVNEIQEAFRRMESDEFSQNPLVKEWVDNLLTKKNGKPVKTWRGRLSALKNFCNTFKLKPEQLIIDKKTYLQILTNCKVALDKGEVVYDRKKSGNADQGTLDGKFHTMKMATRDFVQFHGVALPKNIGGVASGKVINHGQYADIRLTLEEIDRAEQFIEQKFGLDSDTMRLFSVGVCTGARQSALCAMECSWSEIPNPIKPEIIEKLGLAKTVFVMKAYETKTESNWTKYVIRPRAQESLKIHRAKNQFSKIISQNNFKTGLGNSFEKQLSENLREVYRFLGKETVHDGYFMRKPFHALRHIAAQYWIKITVGNLTLVCMTCGWKSDIELKASYGEIPPEMTIEMIGTVSA